MKHKHHIIPRHAGGSDDPSNIVELTIEEHAEAHRLLYEQYNKREDYIAWKSLSGLFTKQEIVLELCKLAGKKQGKINADSGHMTRIQKMLDMREIGKLGGLATIKNKKGAFGNADERRKIAVLGGKKQGKINAESGHLKRIAQLPNNRNSGMIWVTNGITNKMIGKEDIIYDGWKKGKTQKNKV